MSQQTSQPITFACGRYSKRKRTQITYHLDELDVSDNESDYEASTKQVKVRHLTPRSTPPPSDPHPETQTHEIHLKSPTIEIQT